MQGIKGANEGQEQYRVVITSEANSGLEEVAAKVNDGFENGTVTKSNVADYVFKNLAKFLSDTDIKALRALHFDDKKVLGSLLRNETELPKDLKKAIRLHYGVVEKKRKSSPTRF